MCDTGTDTAGTYSRTDTVAAAADYGSTLEQTGKTCGLSCYFTRNRCGRECFGELVSVKSRELDKIVRPFVRL